MHVQFDPLPSSVVIDDYHLSWDLLTPNHLIKGYLVVVSLYLILQIGLEGVALCENAKGFATVPIFSNPVFASTSLIDFWTRRWNIMVHKALKVRSKSHSRQLVADGIISALRH